MQVSFLTTALLIVSLVTNLTVEGIKKLLDEASVKYSSNLLAVIVAIAVSGAVSAIYLIMNDIAFTLKIGVQIIVIMYLGFLIATVGYDKIIQMIGQIQSSTDKK